MRIDSMEFYNTFRSKFGFKGSKHIIDEIFVSLDEDGSGIIGYNELYEFVRGKRHSLDSRRKKKTLMQLKLLPQLHPVSGIAETPTLDDVAWDPEVLRVLVKQMLKRSNLGPADLLRAADDGKKSLGRAGAKETAPTLNQEEFIDFVFSMWPAAIKNTDIWENEISPVVVEVFTMILNEIRLGGKSYKAASTASVVHLQKWLDDPPAYHDVPLKSQQMLQAMAKRRRRVAAANAAKVAATERAKLKKVNIRDRAKASIVNAAKKAHEAAQAKEWVDQVRAREWKTSNGTRWETPKPYEPPRFETSFRTSEPQQRGPHHAKQRTLNGVVMPLPSPLMPRVFPKPASESHTGLLDYAARSPRRFKTGTVTSPRFQPYLPPTTPPMIFGTTPLESIEPAGSTLSMTRSRMTRSRSGVQAQHTPWDADAYIDALVPRSTSCDYLLPTSHSADLDKRPSPGAPGQDQKEVAATHDLSEAARVPGPGLPPPALRSERPYPPPVLARSLSMSKFLDDYDRKVLSPSRAQLLPSMSSSPSAAKIKFGSSGIRLYVADSPPRRMKPLAAPMPAGSSSSPHR